MMTVSGFVPITGVLIVSFLVPTSTLGVVTVCVSSPTVGVLTWYVSSPVFLHAASGNVSIAAPSNILRMGGLPGWRVRRALGQPSRQRLGSAGFPGGRGASRERLPAAAFECGGARRPVPPRRRG